VQHDPRKGGGVGVIAAEGKTRSVRSAGSVSRIATRGGGDRVSVLSPAPRPASFSSAIAHSGSRYITLHIESPGTDELLTGQRRPGPRAAPRERSTIAIRFAAMMNPIII
jgi:hypothetical protein